MKKLILILIIIPSIGNSQIKSFDDIKNLNSISQFKRIMIENSYTKNPSNYMIDNDEYLSYGIGFEEVKEGRYNANKWASYQLKDTKWIKYKDYAGEWYFQFAGLDYDRENGICYFDIIYEQVKKRCKFFKIYNDDEYDYALYSCPNTTYKGKIGFSIQGNTGYIEHFINY